MVVTSLILSIVALIVSAYAAFQARRTADETRRVADETRRIADEARRSGEQSATQERMRARPHLVPEGGSSGMNEVKFSLRNAGAPIGKLRLVADDPSATVNPPHHLGTDEKGYIYFRGRPALPVTVRVEYEDGLGHKDAMSIKLRDGHTFEVLGYDSDKLYEEARR